MRNMIKHAEMERTSVLEKQVCYFTESFSREVSYGENLVDIKTFLLRTNGAVTNNQFSLYLKR